MIPKDPVYPLTAAVVRVKDTIPDQDAEGWLRDAIAADRITWAYVWIEARDHSWPSLIDILPMAAIMEVPDLEVDWLKGTAAVRTRYRGVVECPVVVSRRDLDRELANITASPEATDRQPDGEQGQLSRREQQKAETKAKRERWHQMAQEIKSEWNGDESLKPIGIAKLVAKKEKEATGIEVNPESIKRRLNEDYLGWAD